MSGWKRKYVKIKSQRLRWYGHICRSKKEAPIRIITEWTPTIGKLRGRSRQRWKEQVEKNIKTMKIEEKIGNKRIETNSRES